MTGSSGLKGRGAGSGSINSSLKNTISMKYTLPCSRGPTSSRPHKVCAILHHLINGSQSGPSDVNSRAETRNAAEVGGERKAVCLNSKTATTRATVGGVRRTGGPVRGLPGPAALLCSRPSQAQGRSGPWSQEHPVPGRPPPPSSPGASDTEPAPGAVSAVEGGLDLPHPVRG